MWCSRFTRPPKKGFAIYRNFSRFGCGFAVFDVSVPDFSSFLFCIEILNPFLSTSKIPFELNEKPKLYCRILNKLEVICLTWNGLETDLKRTWNGPKVKKRKKKHKDRLSCIRISWHSNSKKQTWETDQLPTQSEIKVFAVSPRRLLGANTRCKEAILGGS